MWTELNTYHTLLGVKKGETKQLEGLWFFLKIIFVTVVESTTIIRVIICIIEFLYLLNWTGLIQTQAAQSCSG